ncbi:hypothetical protein ACFYW6_07030 [Streptomyces sp. NPDC002659]|uniref:hypothetical protein n=1 Tax=Streptomyces sp. NPDC002659 TaxID=3364656 RepID=UPI0036D1BC3A
MNALTLAGGLIQLAGLAIAGYGVRLTRLEYGPELPGLAGGIQRACASALAYLGLRRPSAHHYALGAALEINMAGRAAGYASPAANASAEQRLDFAVRQAIELQRSFNKLTSQLDAEREARQQAEARLQDMVAEAAATARKELAASHSGGLRLETWGLFLAALGTALGLAGGF